MSGFIPVNEPSVGNKEKEYLSECIETGWISSEGPFLKKLEADFSAYTGQKYGSCVCNGTVALDLAIKVMKDQYNWQDGDEIIMPSFTIISTAQCCVFHNLKPVFIDSEPLTWNIDTSKIEAAITPKTRAIIVVHIYGLPTDMTPVLELAKKYGLKVIEDSAQAHGLRYKDKICGSMSDISTFSFYANKHITCGEGGMVMTSNEELYEKIKFYKNLAFSKDRFIHETLGWNYRMSNLQAAVAYASFERLEETIKKKKRMGALYTELLKDIPAQLPCPKTPYAENNYWVFGIVLNDDVKFNAKEAMERLRDLGIGTRPFFYPMHLQPVFKKTGIAGGQDLPVSKRLYERGFYIPSGLKLTDEQIRETAQKVISLFKG